MVLFINSDQLRQQEKIIAGYFQITKRNVIFLKFLDIKGPRLINEVGMMIVSEFIQDCFSCGVNISWEFLFLRMEKVYAFYEKN